MTLGPFEIFLIVIVVLLLFGGKKFPELMKGLGQGIREFKKASQEDDHLANHKAINHQKS